MLVELIVLRNLCDGVELSVWCILHPLFDLRQVVVHLNLSRSLWALFTAEGFVSKGFLKYDGRSSGSEVNPSAAFFASRSTALLPLMPLCLAIHLSISVYLVFLFLWRIWWAMRSASLAR